MCRLKENGKNLSKKTAIATTKTYYIEIFPAKKNHHRVEEEN